MLSPSSLARSRCYRFRRRLLAFGLPLLALCVEAEIGDIEIDRALISSSGRLLLDSGNHSLVSRLHGRESRRSSAGGIPIARRNVFEKWLSHLAEPARWLAL